MTLPVDSFDKTKVVNHCFGRFRRSPKKGANKFTEVFLFTEGGVIIDELMTAAAAAAA